jgi:Kef-type K+ transport system membrane component KefB
MDSSAITFSFFLIFSGAALFATLALYTRQPLIIAYIALGACIGPFGASLVTGTKLLGDIGHVGIIFLLFLLGLDMQPQALWATLRKSTVVAIFSSCIFMGMGYAVALLFGFSQVDSLIIGAAMMFSSTCWPSSC